MRPGFSSQAHHLLSQVSLFLCALVSPSVKWDQLWSARSGELMREPRGPPPVTNGGCLKCPGAPPAPGSHPRGSAPVPGGLVRLLGHRHDPGRHRDDWSGSLPFGSSPWGGGAQPRQPGGEGLQQRESQGTLGDRWVTLSRVKGDFTEGEAGEDPEYLKTWLSLSLTNHNGHWLRIIHRTPRCDYERPGKGQLLWILTGE